jgi:hypothetical protein
MKRRRDAFRLRRELARATTRVQRRCARHALVRFLVRTWQAETGSDAQRCCSNAACPAPNPAPPPRADGPRARMGAHRRSSEVVPGGSRQSPARHAPSAALTRRNRRPAKSSRCGTMRAPGKAQSGPSRGRLSPDSFGIQALTPAKLHIGAPVAQLDRVPGYEPGGREFESLRARHLPLTFQVSPYEEADHHTRRIETELIARAAFNQCDGCRNNLVVVRDGTATISSSIAPVASFHLLICLEADARS